MRDGVGEVRNIAFVFLCFYLFSTDLSAQVSVLTHHGDNARTGANLNETILTVSNVNPKTFGKLVSRPVDGNIYTQPLVASGVRARNRSGSANLVIVATEKNQVYAFDADDTSANSTTAMVWNTGPNTFGPPIETGTLTNDIRKGICTDVTPEIGITGTPVVQITKQEAPREGVVFVVAKSKTGLEYHYKLFALRLADGSPIGSVEIQGEVQGRGFGSVGGKIRFNPMLELNRPALLLVGNRLYVAFGGHCDMGDYHGWLFSYDVKNPRAMKNVGILNTTPNGPAPGSPRPQVGDGGAGIWMSGEGPSADETGAIYFTTGNGTNNGTSDLGDSLVKTLHRGSKLTVADWFAPENEKLLQDLDVDFGSTGAVLLPDSHQLITGSKDGRMFLLDRDKLGKASVQPFVWLQVTHASMPPIATYGIHGTPTIWRRGEELFIYTAGTEDPIRQFRMVRNDENTGWKFDPPYQFKRGSVTSPYPGGPEGQFGWFDRVPVWMPGGFTTLSARGTDDESGILWVAMPVSGNANHQSVRGMLRALDASDVSKPELWNSELDESDHVGTFAKFVPPTVVNGKVFVATFQRELTADDDIPTGGTGQPMPPDTRAALVIYGLR